MAAHLLDPRVHAIDANGVPYSGAKLFVYDVGTTTLQAIWTDSALSVPATNPLVADSNGYFALTFLTAGTYKVRIEQSDGTLIVEADDQDTGIPLGSGVLAIANGGTGGATAAAARTNLDVPANSEITTITADVLDRLKKADGELTGDTNNSGTGFLAIPSGTTAQRTSPTDGTGLRFNSSESKLEAFINSVWTELLALPTGYIDGLIMSNAADTDHDITVSAGACRNVQTSNSDDHNLRLTTAITKQIDGTWVVGNNQGGLDGGAVGADTWYHVFAIHDITNDITDVLFSSSFDSPTLPTGYTKSRRIGAVLTDGSANITGFTQVGNQFIWDDPPLDIDVASPATGSRTLAAISTPLGVKCVAICNYFYNTNQQVYFSSPDADDEAPSRTVGPLSTGDVSGTGTEHGSQFTITTNTSSQIGFRPSGSNALRVATTSYFDPRGTNE